MYTLEWGRKGWGLMDVQTVHGDHEAINALYVQLTQHWKENDNMENRYLAIFSYRSGLLEDAHKEFQAVKKEEYDQLRSIY